MGVYPRFGPLGLLFVSAFSLAASPDFSVLIDSLNVEGLITAVLALFGLLAGVYLTLKGGAFVLGLLRDGAEYREMMRDNYGDDWR